MRGRHRGVPPDVQERARWSALDCSRTWSDSWCASPRTCVAKEPSMAIRFYGKDGSENGSCPSVSVDEADGSFLFVGWPVNDPALISEIETYSHIDPGEQAFRVPRELRKA